MSFSRLYSSSRILRYTSGLFKSFQSQNLKRSLKHTPSIVPSLIFLRNYSIQTNNRDSETIKMHSEAKILDFKNYRVVIIPALGDNFMYLIVDKASLQALIVDPVEPESVLNYVRKENVTVKSVLTTHHHWDHAGGNEKFVALYSEIGDISSKLEVYGGDDRIGALTNKVTQGDKIKLGNLNIECLFTPCHTTGHICYFLKSEDNSEPPSVFTGDTLFVSGCGKFFEGTPQQMYSALIEKLSQLPDETNVFCGHEYTLTNLKFALKVEPNNEAARQKLSWAEDQRAKLIPTVPSTIKEEKSYNPFMRVILPEVQKLVGASDPVNCMATMRQLKDNFRA